MKPSAKFWDGAAQKYARQPVRDEGAYAQTLDRIRSYLKSVDKVLEVGCGTGSTALTLAPQVEHLHATDLSQRMIDIAQGKARAQEAGNVTFSTMAVGPGVDAGGPFDVVMGLNLLHLVEDLQGALAAMAAQTAEGGLLITKTVCLGEKPGIWRLVLPVMQFIGKAPFVHFLKIANLDRAIEQAGFEIIETGNYPASPPSHFVVARKL